MDMETKTNIFKDEFIPWIIKWGRATNLLGAVLIFGPCVALAFMGILPPWSAFVAAFLIQFPLVAQAYIREPISYFAMLGVPGTYMAFLSGNISNLRVPAASIATKSAGIEEGTDQGMITATIGVAVSTFVSTVFLTVGVVIGAWLLSVLPPIVTSALNLLLPALFASLLANYVFMKPKLGIVVVPACLIIYGLEAYKFLGFIPSAIKGPLLPIICAFGAMGLGVVWAKQGKI